MRGRAGRFLRRLADRIGRLASTMSLPTLFLLGVTHRTAPFGFREKLSLGVEAEAALAAELKQLSSVGEFAILSTCNRVEIYGVATNVTALRRVTAAFCALRQVDPAEFDRFGFVLHDQEAVAHLLHVASGLDSQIVGETEIFGQVKRAYATAQARQSAGPILNRLFQKAFQAAKHVRSTTSVTTGQVSVANVAVDLALSVFGNLDAVKILLIGAGEMGEKSARAFQSRGANHLRVASRHYERAESLAHALAAEALPFTAREERLAEFDIVVCSTSAPGTVISLDAVQTAMKSRKARPLLVVDLAMPRDVDAAVAQLDNVFFYNLDDLAEVAAKNRLARSVGAEAGRRALAPRTDALWQALQIQLATLSDAPSAVSSEPFFYPTSSPSPVG
jgi:glutamyl-tRNA reductase